MLCFDTIDGRELSAATTTAILIIIIIIICDASKLYEHHSVKCCKTREMTITI